MSLEVHKLVIIEYCFVYKYVQYNIVKYVAFLISIMLLVALIL